MKADAGAAPAAGALAALRAFLERRRDELQQEVRAYPGPIAGCDQHLPNLLERRARAIEQLHLIDSATSDADAFARLLHAPALDPDDPEEIGVRIDFLRAGTTP